MKIKIIAALTQKRVIGNGLTIPWYIPEDFKHFKNCTLHNVVIMGLKTFQSIGKALPKRYNIVLSKSVKCIEGVHMCSSYEKGLEEAKRVANERNCDIFIIGGGQIYNRAIDDCDELYLSIVKGDYKGDIYFPKYLQFDEVSSEDRGEFVFKIFKTNSRKDK